MPHHWQPNDEQPIFLFVIIGHTTTDNWQYNGQHGNSMTMSQDNDGTACYLHSTHATYPLCLILNLGATSLSATWQPFNKQLISTPVACMVRILLTPTRCYITGNHSRNNWFPPALLPAQHTNGSPPPSSPCIQVPCCHWRCGNQTLNNWCCHSLLSMGQGQDEDMATAIDPCLYPWQVTDPCNPSYTCTHTRELPWPSWRVQVLVGYRYRSSWWHPRVTCADHYLLFWIRWLGNLETSILFWSTCL